MSDVGEALPGRGLDAIASSTLMEKMAAAWLFKLVSSCFNSWTCEQDSELFRGWIESMFNIFTYFHNNMIVPGSSESDSKSHCGSRSFRKTSVFPESFQQHESPAASLSQSTTLCAHFWLGLLLFGGDNVCHTIPAPQPRVRKSQAKARERVGISVNLEATGYEYDCKSMCSSSFLLSTGKQARRVAKSRSTYLSESTAITWPRKPTSLCGPFRAQRHSIAWHLEAMQPDLPAIALAVQQQSPVRLHAHHGPRHEVPVDHCHSCHSCHGCHTAEQQNKDGGRARPLPLKQQTRPKTAKKNGLSVRRATFEPFQSFKLPNGSDRCCKQEPWLIQDFPDTPMASFKALMLPTMETNN